jgi:hypothetical protein
MNMSIVYIIYLYATTAFVAVNLVFFSCSLKVTRLCTTRLVRRGSSTSEMYMLYYYDIIIYNIIQEQIIS